MVGSVRVKNQISYKSVIQWYNYFRNICTCYFSNNPVIFYGNTTVHIDETAIGGKRKYCRGRIPKTKTRWLFGIMCKDQHRAYVEFVQKRDFLSIIPIITAHINPGATINSDGACVYKVLDHMNYIHNTVIHKDNFVDPVTGAHIN